MKNILYLIWIFYINLWIFYQIIIGMYIIYFSTIIKYFLTIIWMKIFSKYGLFFCNFSLKIMLKYFKTLLKYFLIFFKKNNSLCMLCKKIKHTIQIFLFELMWRNKLYFTLFLYCYKQEWLIPFMFG